MITIYVSLISIIYASTLCALFAILCTIFAIISFRRALRKEKIEKALRDHGTAVLGHVTGRRMGLDYWGLIYSYEFQDRVFTNMRAVLLWNYFMPKGTPISILCFSDDPGTSLAQIEYAPDEYRIASMSAGLGLAGTLIFTFMAVFSLWLYWKLS
jgi:hypothetical protein